MTIRTLHTINLGVKRAHKQGDWLGFDAVQVVPNDFTVSQADVYYNVDPKNLKNNIISRVEGLMGIEGYKINEFIDEGALQDQITFITNYANSEKAKYENTKNSKLKYRSPNANSANDQYILYRALTLIKDAMVKEQKLRDAVNIKITDAQRTDDLASWEALKNSWRTIAEKKTIEDAIKRVKDQIKASQDAQKAEAEKQAKLDELNKKLASAKDPAERQVIASQISSLMGSVSTQTGLPKGALYIGIGIAVVVGIWITIRAIRK